MTTELPGIREQLGILEASLVPDTDTNVHDYEDLLPSDIDTTDELAESVGSIVLDGPGVPGVFNLKQTTSSGGGRKGKKARGKGKGNGTGTGTGGALSRTASTSDSGSLKHSADTQTSGHEDDEAGSGSGSGSPASESQGLAGELELLQDLFPNLYV